MINREKIDSATTTSIESGLVSLRELPTVSYTPVVSAAIVVPTTLEILLVEGGEFDSTIPSRDIRPSELALGALMELLDYHAIGDPTVDHVKGLVEFPQVGISAGEREKDGTLGIAIHFPYLVSINERISTRSGVVWTPLEEAHERLEAHRDSEESPADAKILARAIDALTI